jgi:hypothetical protein
MYITWSPQVRHCEHIVAERVYYACMPFLGTIGITIACYANEYNVRRMFFLLDKSHHVLASFDWQNKASLKRLLQSLPDGVVIHASSEPVYWNTTMERMIKQIDPEYQAGELSLTEPRSKLERKKIFKTEVGFHADVVVRQNR